MRIPPKVPIKPTQAQVAAPTVAFANHYEDIAMPLVGLISIPADATGGRHLLPLCNAAML